ncbi:MAG: hypothetical protein NUV88_01320, partial [Candidatus Kaiserbacteria bacterium]|nr:hypothetical protein [Candidatus Kaiserbacteria bacterium]
AAERYGTAPGVGIYNTPDPTAAAFCAAKVNTGMLCTSTSFFGLYSAQGVCMGGVCVAQSVTALNTGIISAGVGIVSGAVNGVIQLGLRALTESISPRPSTVPTTIPNTSTYCPYGYTAQGTCAKYVPPASGSINTSSQLLNSLRAPNVSDSLLIQANSVTTQYPNQNSGTVVPAANTVQAPQSGTKIGIQLTSTSATIQAGVRDINLNFETSGFFGSNASSGSSPQDLIARICLVRPWQSPLIVAGTPSLLFDNLCSGRSLRVGVLPIVTPPAPAKTVAPATSAPAPQPNVQPIGPYIAPQVSIWASPSSVPVGSRTSIFWTAKGVDFCIETSPDGSFNGTSLYGSASTVPISAPTVFTISCVAPDGSHVTKSVTVNLAI